MGLIKFLIVTIMVMWIIRIALRLIFPVFLKKAFSGAQTQNSKQQHRTRQPEGTISIDYMPNKTEKKGNADNLGEFVDFEEVK